MAPGDLAVLPFQISCGAGRPCLRGRTGNCAAHPRMSTYGLGKLGGLDWGGLLADLVAVPHADAKLVKLPAGVDPVAVASASDNIPDGWRTVGPQLAADPGAEVLVVGGDGGPHSIGLYAAGLAVALGSARVTYLDHNPRRLAIAAALGAQVIDGAPPRKAGEFPITVNASGAPARHLRRRAEKRRRRRPGPSAAEAGDRLHPLKAVMWIGRGAVGLIRDGAAEGSSSIFVVRSASSPC